MKKIGRHAKHAFAFVLALIMVFGTVSVPALALAESATVSQSETGSEGTPSGGTSEGTGETEGTVTTPWYVLEYSYEEKKMSLTLKADIFSYTDITANDLGEFKDALMDALAHMLVGDISSIKKNDTASGEETLNATVAEALYFVMLTDLLTEGAETEGTETEGGSGTTTTLSSERVQQLRDFFAARGITKVSQVNISEMIPVLVQLGYITYEELAALDDDDWDKIFEVFEEEVEKEIAEDMAAEDMAAEDMAAEDMAAEDMAAEDIAAKDLAAETLAKVALAEQGKTEPGANATEEEKQEYADALAVKKTEVLADETKKEELDAKKNEVLADETKKEDLAAKKDEVLADETKKEELAAKKDEVLADETKKEELAAKKDEVLADETKKEELAAKKDEVLTDETKKEELAAKKDEVLTDEKKKEELAAKKDAVLKDEDKKAEIDQKKEDSGAMKDIVDAKQEVIETVDKNKDDADANEISDVNLTKALLDAMRVIRVDGQEIYNGKNFLSDGLRAVIEALPTLAEIADYTDEEMTHTWKIFADSAFGSSEFDFSLSLDGDSEPLRRVAGLLADYTVYERRDDGTFALELNLPQKFADLMLRVFDRDEFKNSEWWDRIFDNIFSNGDDIHALLNDVAFADILDALKDFDFNGVIGEEEIKDIYGSELTNEEILEKIRATETLYNKIVSLFNTIFSSLSDAARQKSIFDFYNGNGVFHASGSRDGVNIEEALSKLLPEAYKDYASLIAGMMEEQTVTIAADVTLRFTDMYRATFSGDKTQYAFLPAGATLSDFAKALTYKGYPIVGWSNADGSVKYTEMPAADTVLYPVIEAKATAQIKWQGKLSKVYDNNNTTLIASVDYDDVYDRAAYTYQWYKNGTKLEGKTEKTLPLKNVSDSGKYYCIVTVTDGADTFPATSDEVTVSVTKRLYTASDHFAWDYSAPFFPDGQTHTVTLVQKNIDAYADVSISYTGDPNAQSTVGRYTTVAAVTFGNENCGLADAVPSLTWAIGAREFEIKDTAGKKLGTATLLTNGVAPDPTLRLVAIAKSALDLDTVVDKLPAGADKICSYVYELAFLDEEGKAVCVGSELSFSVNLNSDLAASHLAVMSVNGSTLTTLEANRDAGSLSFESDAHLTVARATFAIVSYQYKLTLDGGNGYTGVYDGAEHSIGDPTVSYAGGADATYTYQWYKDSSLLTGANDKVYTVSTVAQSGSYELWVTVKDGYAVHTEKLSVTVDITKLRVDLSSLTWSATELPYRAGVEQEVTLILNERADIAHLTFTYERNKATAIGNYTATATVSTYDDANCELFNKLPENAWSISNKSYAVTDHFGNTVLVSSETAFPAGYTLVAEWIGDSYDDTLPTPSDDVVGSYVGGHYIYFKDEGGEPVVYNGQVTISLTVPSDAATLTLRLAKASGASVTLTDATRAGDVFTLTASSLSKDTAYLMVAYRTLIDTSRVTPGDFVYRLFAEDREIVITADLLKNLPDGVIATVDTTDGSDFSAERVGAYEVRVTFTLEDGYENYALDVSSRKIAWSILPYNFIFDEGLTWNYSSKLTYRGSDYVFRVPVAEAYAAYFDIGYTKDTAKNVGTYAPEITFSLKADYRSCCTLNGAKDMVIVESTEFTVLPKAISSDLILWNETSFVFDGEAHRPTLKPLNYTVDGVYNGELLSDIVEIGAYSGKEAVHVLASDADSYVVTVSLSVKNENYRLTASTLTLEWRITPKTLSLDGVRLERDLFVYDGAEKTAVLDLSALPVELTAFLDPATEVSATERGAHTVTAVLALKAGLRPLDYSFASRLDLSYSIKTPIDPSGFTFGETSPVYSGEVLDAPALIIADEYRSLVRIDSKEGDLTAIDAGTYRVTYIFSMTSAEMYYLTQDTCSYDWTVEKQKLTLPALTWTQEAFVYNTHEHTVSVTTPLHENIRLAYENEKATNAGKYKAKVAFELIDSANYELVYTDESTYEYVWEITQATVSVPDFPWQEELSFGYDGEEKTILAILPALPDGVTAAYEDNAKTDAGTYIARVILTHDDANYRVVIGDTDSNMAEREWKVLPISVTVGELTWNLSEREFVYSEEERSFLVTSTLPAHITLQYVVDGNVTNVIGDIGTYTVRVLLIADPNYTVADEAEREFTFTVTKKQITVNAFALRWVTDAASDRYNAKEHTYTLSGMPAHVKATYEGNSATALGEYTAVATLLPENDNYEIVLNGTVPTKAWSIVKGVYDMSGIRFEDATFNYDGKRHSLTVSGTLPKGVDASYSLKDKIEAGVYTVTVTFKGSSNYEPIPSMTAVMTILRETYTVVGSGNTETLVITAPNGLTYQLIMEEQDAAEYKNLDFFGIGTLNQTVTPRAAYDIFFTDGADGEAHADGTFTVKLLIPENLRSKNLKVVHLNDDGELKDMNATREGDYLVFTTDGFSVYMIAETASILSDLVMKILLIAVCVLLVLLVVLHILLRRRRAKRLAERKEYPNLLKDVDLSAFDFGGSAK